MLSFFSSSACSPPSQSFYDLSINSIDGNEIKFSNLGGLPMPIILKFEFIDKTNEVIRIPAEIWRRYEDKVSKVFMFDKRKIKWKRPTKYLF